MYVPALAEQDYQNRLELGYDYRTAVGPSRRPKLVDEPYIVWHDYYKTERGIGQLLRVVQELSDYMLLNKNNLYSQDNPNQRYLIDAVKGKLHKPDYQTAEYTYGDKSNVGLVDNNFYTAAKNKLTTQVFNAPLLFTCNNINPEFINQQAKKAAKTSTKLAANLYAEYAAGAGHDVSFLQDDSVNMHGSVDEVLKQLNDSEKLEYAIYKLVNDINFRYDLRNIERKCFSNKFDINGEFGFVEVINNDVVPRHLNPEQVTWVSSEKNIENLEHPSVLAVAVNDYLSINQIMNKWSRKLNNGIGSKGLLETIRKIRAGMLEKYNPDRNYFSEIYYANADISDPLYAGPKHFDSLSVVDYNNHFYPFVHSEKGLEYSILEQKMYFKMMRDYRYIVLINGKRPTESQWRDWQKGNLGRKLVATFEEIPNDEKAPKGAFIKYQSKSELWEATRIGHDSLINLGRYEYDTNSSGRSNYVGFPVVMQISYEKSLAALGYHLNRLSNILYNRVEELIIAVGHSTAIVFDESIGGNPNSFLYNAKKSGIAYFNSQKAAGNANSKYQHFDMIQLGSSLKDVADILTTIGMLKILYENMIGASPQAQGVAQAYAGLQETQLNIQNQSELAQPYFNDHYLFMNQFLQREADIVKKAFAREDVINVRVTEEISEILKLSADLDTCDPDIRLQYGPDKKGKKDLINNAVMQLMSAGGVEMLEPLINIFITDNPNEALAILRANAGKIAEAQAARDKQMAEANRLNAQAMETKARIPVDVAQVNKSSAVEVANIRTQQQQESDKMRGMAADVKHYQDQSNRVLESDLRTDEENFRKDKELSNQAQFAAIDAAIGVGPEKGGNENNNQ